MYTPKLYSGHFHKVKSETMKKKSNTGKQRSNLIQHEIKVLGEYHQWLKAVTERVKHTTMEDVLVGRLGDPVR